MSPENKQGHLTIVFWKFVPNFFSVKPIRNNVNIKTEGLIVRQLIELLIKDDLPVHLHVFCHFS